MSNIFRFLLVLSLTGFTAECNAAGVFTGASCVKWNKAKINKTERMQREAYIAYIYGFVSGVAFGADIELIKDKDDRNLIGVIDAFCEDNPAKDISDGAKMLTNLLQKNMGN